MAQHGKITIVRHLRAFHIHFSLSGLARFQPLAYAVLRVAYGVVIFTHGLPKALGTSHGSMADPMAGSTRLIAEVMGLPFAPQLAVLVMLLETLGAICLAAGFMTRLLALAFVVEVIGIAYALGPVWPWIDRGIEYPVMLAFTAIYMLATGGGRYSADHMLESKPADA
ncbi:DoxX family protein [Kordiimonas gwangyangensis]|uniref:DoxX family protein n=1 Tax=Kordiimonas gwangyangensis TaxID=288022 RepID=UPI00036B6E8B|nr:DoxX family protein [Kordiimonas gwangyangensis]